jgi:hypothetical protein
MHLSCTKISTISKRTELAPDLRLLGVPSEASKMIFEPMVRLVQTVHLSCTNTNIISKQKEASFHMTTSPRSSIRCVQNDFQANGTFDANRAPVLRQY